jgi:hypothetical protein
MLLKLYVYAYAQDPDAMEAFKKISRQAGEHPAAAGSWHSD